MTLGGNIIVTNGIDYDYCFAESIMSLLPICDVVNVCDSDSTDGTKQVLEKMARTNPKIRILNYPWIECEGNRDCVLNKMNWSREQLGTDFHIHLEADEVLDEGCYDYLRSSMSNPDSVIGFSRLNFWEDTKHILSPGQVLSPLVIRFAPTRLWLGGDAPHPKSAEAEKRVSWDEKDRCRIFHYGFLRKPEAYLKKSTELVKSILGEQYVEQSIFYSPLKKAVAEGSNWMKEVNLSCVPFSGSHPNSMLEWLKKRGHQP